MITESPDSWIKVVGCCSAIVVATVGLATYVRNANTKAAEFLLELHKSFFIDDTYQGLKAILDCDTAEDEQKLRSIVQKEAADFTDFLNFFELIAYLTEIRTLKPEHTEALLGYYLDKLRSKKVVWEYVRDSSHGFENLRHLLQERNPR